MKAKALAILAVVLVASAHVGSPDTVFEGAAGPYALRVIIKTPGVVPGLADIAVRVTRGPAVTAITVLPLRGGRATAALPPADTARAVPGADHLYAAQLWLMTFGAYSVQVNVDGAGGRAQVLVPVMAVATRRLPLDRMLSLTLAALGVFLVVGAVTIVGAAVRDSVLDPGTDADDARRARAWLARGGAVVVIAVILYFSRQWWNAEDRDYTQSIYHPLHATASVRPGPAPTLAIAIDDSAWNARQVTPLIPDHGKLMHAFLVAADGNGFAHLHPVASDSSHFAAALPPLPTGRYRVYADVVHESGFTETLVDSVTLPPPAGAWRASDPDDAWSTAAPSTTASSALADGAVMLWTSSGDSLVAGRDVELQFAVRDARGKALPLEPYMGMMAHAAITTPDGSVFVHLHPLGTIATASQLVYALRDASDTVRGRLGGKITAYEDSAGAMAGMPMPVIGRFSLPYVFPKPGAYRVYVQVRRAGHVDTAVFGATVR